MHSGNLFGYAFKFLHCKDDANDIVQDVFEKLWIHRRKVEAGAAKTWMFKTAHNAMINLVKKNNRVEYVEEIDSTECSANLFNKIESQEVVDRAVSILPPVQKSIIILRDLEGYSYQEIGSILSLNESQVKVYLFRARKKIKNQLKGIVELV